MHELNDLNPDVLRAEIAYRRERLVPQAWRSSAGVRHWWQRIGLVPRERS